MAKKKDVELEMIATLSTTLRKGYALACSLGYRGSSIDYQALVQPDMHCIEHDERGQVVYEGPLKNAPTFA